jgi:hypothetical protein
LLIRPIRSDLDPSADHAGRARDQTSCSILLQELLNDALDFAIIILAEVVPGKILFRFHARDLNLVLAPAKDGKPVRFVARLDRATPGENHGVDTAPDGSGEIHEPRLYQLIRQKGPIVDRTFEIEFLDLGVHALDFTFG